MLPPAKSARASTARVPYRSTAFWLFLATSWAVLNTPCSFAALLSSPRLLPRKRVGSRESPKR